MLETRNISVGIDTLSKAIRDKFVKKTVSIPLVIRNITLQLEANGPDFIKAHGNISDLAEKILELQIEVIKASIIT